MANYSLHRDEYGNPPNMRRDADPLDGRKMIRVSEGPPSPPEQKKKRIEGYAPPWVIFDPAHFSRIVKAMDAHLDEDVPQEYKDQPLAQDWARVSKAFEEGGESIDALIGYTGQNPRKGVYGSQEDMLKELADTALSAIYAIQHFTKNEAETMKIIYDTAVYHADRMDLDVA